MFRHEELCDHCEQPLRRGKASENRGFKQWTGLRFGLYGTDRSPIRTTATLPGHYESVDHREPIQIHIRSQIVDGACSSTKTSGVVLPGVVCSTDCFVAWMTAQMDAVLKELDGKLALPKEETRPRAVELED